MTPDPPTGDNSDSWLQNHAHLYLQIINTIEPSISFMVSRCEYVKELMDYLDFLYSGQSNIYRGEQHDRSLSTYVTEFKKLYEKLNSLLPLSVDVKAMQT